MVLCLFPGTDATLDKRQYFFLVLILPVMDLIADKFLCKMVMLTLAPWGTGNQMKQDQSLLVCRVLTVLAKNSSPSLLSLLPVTSLALAFEEPAQLPMVCSNLGAPVSPPKIILFASPLSLCLKAMS